MFINLELHLYVVSPTFPRPYKPILFTMGLFKTCFLEAWVLFLLSCSYGLDDGIVAYDEPFDDELFCVIDYNNLQLFASLAPSLDDIHNFDVLNIDHD